MTRKFTFLILALFALIASPGWGQNYQLVTSTDDLVAGCNYVIGNGKSGSVKFMSTVENANNRKITNDITVSTDGEVTIDNTVLKLELGGTTGAWTLKTTNYLGTNGYLASAASGSNNYCRVIADKTTATISFSDNAVVITIRPHTSRNILRYNSSSSCFACYSSGQNAVYLYKESTPSTVAAPTFDPEAGTYYEDKSIELSAEDGCTIYYTLNGDTPTAESEEYSTPIQLTVPSTTTIKAIAVDGEDNSSNVASATYTLKRSQFTPAQLLAEVEPDNQSYTVVFTDEEIKSFYEYNYNNAGFYIETTEGDFLVYKSGTPSNWEVGGKVSGTVTGTWKTYNTLKEFCPANYDGFSYTAPTHPLPAPTNLTVSNLSMTGATLSWNAVEHASSYTVKVIGDDYDNNIENIVSTNVVLDDLTAGKEYMWTVKAIGDGETYLNSDESETADFTTPTTALYNVTIVPADGGTIKAQIDGEDITQAANGTTVNLIANPNTHFTFTSWNVYGTEEPYTVITVTDNAFTMPNYNVTITATFTEDPKYDVTYDKGGEDVVGDDPETVSYYVNDVVILEENPYTRTGFTFNGWQVKDAEENDVTVDEGTFEMPASDVTVTPYWDEKDQYTVTYKSLGETIATEQVYEGDLCTNVPTLTDIPTGWTFLGWTTGSADNTTTAPEPFDLTTPIISATTLNAVFTKTEGETSWDETELADLTSSDVFVMVGNDSYAVKNAGSTNKGPAPVEVTINEQTVVEPTDEIKWILTGNDTDGYTFYSNANNSNYLYCSTTASSGSNDNLRVGSSGNRNLFVLTNDAHLKTNDNNVARYIGINGTSDFRGYTSSSTNSVTFKFYKLNAGTTYYTTIAPATEYTIAIDGSIEHGTVEVEGEITSAIAGTEITLVVTPDQHYSLTANSLTVTGESLATVEVNPVTGTVGEYTFVMPDEDVTITAQFTEDTKYTVSCYANGSLVSTGNVYAGEIQLPVSVTAPNGYTFVGWTTEPIVGVAQTATYFSSFNVTEIVNLYAVFAIAETGGTTSVTKDIIAEAGITASVTLNADNNPYQMGELPITLTGRKGTSNFPALNYNATNGTDLRFYKGTTCGVTFATTNNSTITKIEFKKNAETASTLGDAFSANVGTLSANVWTGSAESVTISYSADATFKEQMYIINVTYSENSPSTYSNFCTTVTALSGIIASQTNKGAYYIKATETGEPAQINGTVTINGALGNADPTLLIIEDGAQLIHSSKNVMATVKKSITGYETEGFNVEADRTGYYLIANPTNVATVAHLNDNNYDLYTFNPEGDGAGNEWINMKSSQAVANGTGYLYANSSDVTLEFAGELTPATSSTFDLTYAEEDTGIDFPGFNLIGNPYACNAYPTDENGIFMPFYKTNETGSELTLVENVEAIAPCEGFFIEADYDGQQVIMTTEEPEAAYSALCITVSQNRGNVIDRAIVNFNGNSNLHKFMMNPAHTNIRLAKNGEEFAAISSEAQGELPVNFKAEKNGSYTITVNTENVEAQYLHLIDNKTGMDTDLLSSSSYTFEAKTSDYASRFKLVFNVKNEEANSSSDNNFAFMSDGNLVIDNIEGEATLQIADELGRIISTETVSGSYNKALNLKAGLYILNLNGMTQKIVVK